MAGPIYKYEDYVTECWTLSSAQAATNFIRSQFDYGTRQRRAVRGYDTQGVRIVLDSTQLTAWESFWLLLNDGTDKFYTDQVINGDTTTGKIARFMTGYTLSELGGDLFEVSVPVELIQTGV